ncbi:hypothetical protein T03_16921 [Trichinella britovi]|uniref:Uncharacterized protein n=1 Tax=Trichinella britovi TaxID=45882 RepID=A0A0V1DDT4_TRIBR|nr:hypothetical protein T03_16921 [Trichinella britovi]
MTHLAFRKDIAAHLLNLRSSRGHFLQSRTQGRCTVRKETAEIIVFSVANGFTI